MPKPPETTAGGRASAPTSAKTAAKPAGPKKAAAPAKRAAAASPRSGTAGGRMAIAILGGLAIGLLAMAIYGFNDSGSDWAFNRPSAQLPSLQSKHTLY